MCSEPKNYSETWLSLASKLEAKQCICCQTTHTFGALPHVLHVRRQVLGHQRDERVVVLELVDQIVAVEGMRTPLRLTAREMNDDHTPPTERLDLKTPAQRLT